MTRAEDWPQRLAAFIEARRHTPFAWGVHDCCQFARAAVAEIRGADPAAHLDVSSYQDKHDAEAILGRLGGVEALPAACGLAEIPIARAGRGDVVCVDNQGRAALGVCLGAQSAFPGGRGLQFLPTLDCRRAWRI